MGFGQDLDTIAVCSHHWHIAVRESDNHHVGRCQLCNAERDYTELLNNDRGYRDLFKPANRPVHMGSKPIGITMSNVMFTSYDGFFGNHIIK